MGPGRGAGPAPVFLSYQLAWMADLSPVKVIEKSRRIGITWAEASDDVLLAGRADGMDVWYIGYNREMAMEFIQDAAFWVRHYNLAARDGEELLVKDENRDILSYRIRFASGHRLTALSSRPANLRGKQGKVVIDEAAFHHDLPGLLKAAVALLMWGGRLAVISTHLGESNPFNELVNDIRSGRRLYSLHRVTLDDALREGLYRRICVSLGRQWSREAQESWRGELIDLYGDDAEEELFCAPSSGTGAYLSRALVEACMDAGSPVFRWACRAGFAELPESVRSAETSEWCRARLDPSLGELAPNSPCWFGEDFGRSGDLTVIVPLQELPGLRYRAPFAVELSNVPFRQQEQVLFHLADRLPGFRAGALDARGNGQYLAEAAMQRYGPGRILQVMLSERWYLENMPPYKAALEDRAIALPLDPDILDDHRAFHVERGIARIPRNHRSRGRDGLTRHGDSAVACALAWHAVRSGNSGPVEYETASQAVFSRIRGAW